RDLHLVRRDPILHQTVEELLALCPEGRAKIMADVERANRLRAECGCAMGGRFFIISGCLAAVYLVQHFHAHLGTLLKMAALLSVAVFTSSIAGKLTGIAIARVRLRLLRRRFAALLTNARMKTHVCLH